MENYISKSQAKWNANVSYMLGLIAGLTIGVMVGLYF